MWYGWKACLLGPAIAPLAGGIAAHYYTWRHMQFILFIASTLLAIFMLVYLPETSQPRSRGIDKLLESESSLVGEDDVDRSSKQRRRWVWLNPFQSVAMFRSPNLLAVVSEQCGDVSLLFLQSLMFLCHYVVWFAVPWRNDCLDDGLW